MNTRLQPRSRLLFWVSSFGILALLIASAVSQAADSDREFKPLTGTLKEPVPFGQREITAVLQLAGDPVAVVRSQSPDRALLSSEQNSIERSLRIQQDAIAPAVARQGGRVLATYQYAVNGIKVRGTPTQIANWAKLPGVIGVKPVRTYQRSNTESVPYIGAPKTWNGPAGLHGEHIRIGIVDGGIDYTHANFGGPGTVAAYQAAFANATQPADPRWFGPDAPKIKGGTDLVGDQYDSHDPASIPVPDPNPLDCEGHGSHVAGTAAGFGVTSDGKTFRGPYDAKTPKRSFIVGPGVAPLADLYAIKVFGCTGTTDVLLDAIEWAVAHDMQVINMSVGSPFGAPDDIDSLAADNAVKAGVVIIASSGNNGVGIPYITGSPATGSRVIDVGAVDSFVNFQAEKLGLSTGPSIVAMVANDVPLSQGAALPIVVLRSASGDVSTGCDPQEYVNVTGKLVVTKRGVCARVARAIFGQKAGAAAVAMINDAAGFPPHSGMIVENPDALGEKYLVTIPFLGIQGATETSNDGATLVVAGGANGNATYLAAAALPNPVGGQVAAFSSAGPRHGDGHLKPDIVAPGESIVSTYVGTGSLPDLYTGTSMAAPHVAGVAALVIQAHPRWRASDVAAAVVNTADAGQVVNYAPQLAGSGLVQPFAATRTSVVARSADGAPNMSFGVEEFTRDFRGGQRVWLQNRGPFPALFAVSVADSSGAPHKASVGQRYFALGGFETRPLDLQLNVPVAGAGDSSAFRHAQGRVVLDPVIGNSRTTLSVPYYMVARARSDVRAELSGDLRQGTGTLWLDNRAGMVAGTGDLYAWGLRGTHSELGSVGIRSVGVKSVSDASGTRILAFAVNTFGRVSQYSTRNVMLDLDSDGDGVADYMIVAGDLGILTGAALNGQIVTAVFDLVRGGGVFEFYAKAANDGATIILPVVAAHVGVTAANPRFSYTAQIYDGRSLESDSITIPASFNAFSSAISNGAFATVLGGQRVSVPVSVDDKELALTPALGIMVVANENSTKGNRQALLLPLKN